MAELNEAEIAAAKEQANAEFEASLEDLSDEEKEAKRAERDAEAVLQAEREAELKRERELGRKEGAAAIAFKNREKERKGEDEKPLTASELKDILTQDRQETRKELQAEAIAHKASELATSPAEAELIIEIHKNRTFPAGLSLGEQLEEAYAIANRKPLLAQNEELKRALKSKETASKDTAGTHKDSPALDEPKISSQDIAAIKASGFVWDGKSRLYIKDLGKEKKLIYDPKTKKTQRV